MAYHCTVSRTYGAQFTSNKYKEFAQIYGFEHTTPSPYWSYNGKAKAAKKKDAKPTLKKSHDIHLILLNIRNTPPFGHSFSPAQRRMGRSTRSTLPTHRVILTRKPDPPDQLIVYAEISRHKKACKTQYNKHMNTDLPLLPLGSHAYAKPRPSQQGTPWIYGQIIGHLSPCLSFVAIAPNCGQRHLHGTIYSSLQHYQSHSLPFWARQQLLETSICKSSTNDQQPPSLKWSASPLSPPQCHSHKGPK